MNDLVLGGGGGGGGGGSTPINTPDNLFSDDILEFTLGICEGPIGGLVSGPKSFFLGDTALQSATGTDNFSAFQLDIYHGDANASVITPALGGVTSNSQVNVPLAQNVPVVRTTPATLRNLIDILEVRLVINQLIQSNDKGDQLVETARFKLQYRAEGTTVWKNWYDEVIGLTGKTSGGYVKEFRKGVPRSAANWEIQVIKLNPDNLQYHVVAITWESFQCVTSERRAYDNLAVIKGLGRASDQFSSVPEFSGIFAGKLVKIPNNYNPLTKHYSGFWDGTFILAHTDNPAWCCYDILMNEQYGMKRHFPPLLCDRFSFYEAARWCDQLVPRGATGTFQPRYTYNDLLEQPRPGIEQARYIASVFGAILVSDLNKTLKLKVDKPAAMVQIFGPESVSDAGFSYQFSDITQRANDLLVSFINPDLGWQTDVRQVHSEPLILANGRIPLDFVAVGCIDVFEAQRRAYNMLLKSNTETTTVLFQTARQGILLEIFDVIGVADPDMNWGLTGRVKSVAGAVITLRDALLLPVNTQLDFALQTPTGIVNLKVQTSLANTKTLTIVAEGVYPPNAPNRAQFVITSANYGLAKPFRVMGITQDTENGDLFNVVALEMNTARYSDVDNMVSSVPKDYQGSISQALPAPVITHVESGLAHQIVSNDGIVLSRMLVELGKKAALSGETEIFYRRVGFDDVQSVKTNSLTCYIPKVEIGQQYEIYAVAYGHTGKRSRQSATILHTVAGRSVLPTRPSGWTGVGGLDTITLTGDAHPDADFAAFVIYGATASSDDLVYLDSVTATRYVRRVAAGDPFTRYQISAVNRSGTEGAKTAFISVSRLGVVASDVDTRGMSILDTFGAEVFGSNGHIGSTAYVSIDGSNVQLSEMAAKSLVPSLNFVGSFATAPTQASLGAQWQQNAVYKNSADGKSYVLTGSPLAWVLYLEDGKQFYLVVESSNGNIFRPGTNQSTMLIARVFKNGAEVTAETSANWFRWRRVSVIPRIAPNDDATWNSLYYTGYKQINISVDQVYARATFFCDVIST